MRYPQFFCAIVLALAATASARGQTGTTTAPTAVKLNSCGGSWSYTTNYSPSGPAGVARFVLTMQDTTGNEVDITFQPQATAVGVTSAVQSGSTWAISLQAPQTDQDGFFHLIVPSQIYYIEVDLNVAPGSTTLAHFTVSATGGKC